MPNAISSSRRIVFNTNQTIPLHAVGTPFASFSTVSGKPFNEASGYDDHINGERDANRLRVQEGFGHTGFGYIASFRDDYPPSVRKYLTDTPITSLVVARRPIKAGVDKLLNLISLGGWNKAKKEEGYEEMLHLYLSINSSLILERNGVIEMYPGPLEPTSETMTVPIPSTLTLKSLLTNTSTKYGKELQRYDPANNNCQVFLIQVLTANGLLTDTLRAFISQDVKSVFTRLPWFVQALSKVVTDTSHIIDKVTNGNGRIAIHT